MSGDFFKVDKYPADPNFERKLKEMDNHYKFCVGEISRIEASLSSRKADEASLLDLQKTNRELTEVNEKLNHDNNALVSTISKNTNIIADLEDRIKAHKKEEKLYSDLSEEVTQLEKTKNEIIAFNAANKVERDDLSYIRQQIDLAKTHLSELEKKSKDVVNDMNEKKLLADKYARESEKPLKILEENKQVEASIKTSLEATKKLIEEEGKKPGSVVEFIRKAQRKYPQIDLLNI